MTAGGLTAGDLCWQDDSRWSHSGRPLLAGLQGCRAFSSMINIITSAVAE
jgi:hypothetical protein